MEKQTKNYYKTKNYYNRRILISIENDNINLISEAYHMLTKFIETEQEVKEIFKNWNENSEIAMISEEALSRAVLIFNNARLVPLESLKGPRPFLKVQNIEKYVNSIEKALYASFIVSYARGYERLAKQNQGEILSIQSIDRASCPSLLNQIKKIYETDYKSDYNVYDNENKNEQNLLLTPIFAKITEEAQAGWRSICSTAIFLGVPVPKFLETLSYYDSLRTGRL